MRDLDKLNVSREVENGTVSVSVALKLSDPLSRPCEFIIRLRETTERDGDSVREGLSVGVAVGVPRVPDAVGPRVAVAVALAWSDALCWEWVAVDEDTGVMEGEGVGELDNDSVGLLSVKLGESETLLEGEFEKVWELVAVTAAEKLRSERVRVSESEDVRVTDASLTVNSSVKVPVLVWLTDSVMSRCVTVTLGDGIDLEELRDPALSDVEFDTPIVPVKVPSRVDDFAVMEMDVVWLSETDCVASFIVEVTLVVPDEERERDRLTAQVTLVDSLSDQLADRLCVR